MPFKEITENLKRCPFCGSPVVMEIWSHTPFERGPVKQEFTAQVRCSNEYWGKEQEILPGGCGLLFEMDHIWHTPEDAEISARVRWNRRAT